MTTATINNIREKWENVRQNYDSMPDHLILPNEMDWKQVWDEYVEADPGAICGAYVDEFPEISQIRRMNAHLYQTLGVLSYLMEWGSVVDIGAGYNALNLLLNKNHEYIPIDVKDYTPETLVVSGNGEIPIKSDSIDHVICNNVFQHVPQKIRVEYMKEVFRILKPGGKMFLGMCMDQPYIQHKSNLIDGKRYVVTGDYFVPIATMEDFSEMAGGFTVLTKTERSDGFTAFWLAKPEEQRESDESN